MPVLCSTPIDVSLKVVEDAKSIGGLKGKMGELMEVLPCSKCTEITASGEPLK